MIFLISLLLFPLFCSAEPLYDILFPKPNPCYGVRSYEISGSSLLIRLSLKEEGVLCPQVVTEDAITLAGEEAGAVETVKVYVNGRLWWEGPKRVRSHQP